MEKNKIILTSFRKIKSHPLDDKIRHLTTKSVHINTSYKIKNYQQSNMYSRIKIQYILQRILGGVWTYWSSTSRLLFPHYMGGVIHLLRSREIALVKKFLLLFSSLLMIHCWFFLGCVVATVVIPANDQAMLCGEEKGSRWPAVAW